MISEWRRRLFPDVANYALTLLRDAKYPISVICMGPKMASNAAQGYIAPAGAARNRPSPHAMMETVFS
jgi:hypothetical protein